MSEKIDIPTLFELTREEAIALKQHATPEEIENLDLATLKNTRDYCIYGQMTGDCSSKRAVELITQCAQRVYDNLDTTEFTIKLNGSPVGKRRGEFSINYFSPIETMLIECDKTFNKPPRDTQNMKNLVAFLKGETDELIFTEEGLIVQDKEDAV